MLVSLWKSHRTDLGPLPFFACICQPISDYTPPRKNSRKKGPNHALEERDIDPYFLEREDSLVFCFAEFNGKPKRMEHLSAARYLHDIVRFGFRQNRRGTTEREERGRLSESSRSLISIEPTDRPIWTHREGLSLFFFRTCNTRSLVFQMFSSRSMGKKKTGLTSRSCRYSNPKVQNNSNRREREKNVSFRSQGFLFLAFFLLLFP